MRPIRNTEVNKKRKTSSLSFRTGLVLLSVLALCVVLGYTRKVDASRIVTGQALQAPSGDHWFGTDELGRDVFGRAVEGVLLSIELAAAISVLSSALAVPLGLLAGWVRGAPNEVLGRLFDLGMGIPPLLFMLFLLALTGPSMSRTIIGMTIVSSWPVARVVRAETMRIRDSDFVEAASARGESARYSIFREVLPNVIPLILVETTFRFGLIVQIIAVLSFLGLGVQPPRVDLGLLILQGRPFMELQEFIMIGPAILLIALILTVNLIGDGLRDGRNQTLRA